MARTGRPLPSQTSVLIYVLPPCSFVFTCSLLLNPCFGLRSSLRGSDVRLLQRSELASSGYWGCLTPFPASCCLTTPLPSQLVGRHVRTDTQPVKQKLSMSTHHSVGGIKPAIIANQLLKYLTAVSAARIVTKIINLLYHDISTVFLKSYLLFSENKILTSANMI